jgi:hypothetical protein
MHTGFFFFFFSVVRVKGVGARVEVECGCGLLPFRVWHGALGAELVFFGPPNLASESLERSVPGVGLESIDEFGRENILGSSIASQYTLEIFGACPYGCQQAD